MARLFDTIMTLLPIKGTGEKMVKEVEKLRRFNSLHARNLGLQRPPKALFSFESQFYYVAQF